MLTKNVRRLDQEKGVNKHFQNALGGGRIQKFFQVRDIKFWHFFEFFFGRINLKQIEKQKRL